MSKGPHVHLLFSIIIAFAAAITALQLPYEVLDSIVELSNRDDFKDLNQVNVSDDRGPTRPIYRLDLDPDYIAYYEIDTGSDYIVLSSGPKSGDYREVESGPVPRPTDALIRQAQDNRQRCEKFYRLSPLGLTVCKDDNGTVVAASYDWTADVAQIEDWRQLDGMVKDSLDRFKRQWRERATQRRTKLDWATTEVVPKGGEKKKKETDEEELSPGSTVKLALGERFKSVDVYVTNGGDSRIRPSLRSEWQQKLCKVLVNVCLLDRSTKVNPSAIKKTANHLLYLQLEVHGNRTFVGNVLQWREIGFIIEIRERSEMVRKRFAINLQLKRFRRSPGGTLIQGTVSSEKDFPDYDQHKCCGNCWSGCSPVAWAQVFGYYDRLASSYSNSIYSPTIYGDSSTKAPLWLTDAVKSFVEDIRTQVQTFCSNGMGSTFTSKMHLIAPWFRARQGSKASVISHLESRKRRSIGGGRVERGSRSWIESKGVKWLQIGYPVVFSFTTESNAGHSAVATKYKKTSRRYRHCEDRKTGWLWGRRTKTVCSWKTAYDYEFFLHYGWGGSNNKWQEVSPFSAHVAYIVK